MHPPDTLGGSKPEIRDQQLKIDAEIAGRFDPAARRGVAKPLDTLLKPVHVPILTSGADGFASAPVLPPPME